MIKSVGQSIRAAWEKLVSFLPSSSSEIVPEPMVFSTKSSVT